MTASGAPSGAAVGLTSDTSRRNSLPVVSPDVRIAYVSTRRGEQPNIWMMDINGGASLQTTVDEAPDHEPSGFPTANGWRSCRGWLPPHGCGPSISRPAGPSCCSISPQRARFDSAGFLGELQAAPSMKQVVFSMLTPPLGRRDFTFRAWITTCPGPLVTSPCRWAIRLGHPTSDSSRSRSWKADRRTPVLSTSSRGSCASSRANAARRGCASWSPDGRRLAVAALRDGQWSLRAIDVTTGTQHVIYETRSSRAFVRYPDWSARGDVIVFERGEMRANIWTLALNKPN